MKFAGVSADEVSRLLSHVDDAMTRHRKAMGNFGSNQSDSLKKNHQRAIMVLTELCVQMATLADQIREGERGPEPFTLK